MMKGPNYGSFQDLEMEEKRRGGEEEVALLPETVDVDGGDPWRGGVRIFDLTAELREEREVLFRSLLQVEAIAEEEKVGIRV